MTRFCIMMLIVLGSVATAAAQSGPPALLQEIRVAQRLDQQIPPELSFRDAEGRRLSWKDLGSPRPALLVPVYYECPMLCTESLRGLVGALKALPFDVGLDFDVFVVSFDPREGPELARSKRAEMIKLYGERGAPSGWRFLIGDDVNVRKLTESIGFHYVYDPNSDLFAHASALVLLTPDGRISRYFFGIDYAPRDLRLGLVEASKGAVGSVVDELLLYCFQYDPLTGRYGVIIMNVLRVAGALTVALLGGFMLAAFRRDRRRTTLELERHTERA